MKEKEIKQVEKIVKKRGRKKGSGKKLSKHEINKLTLQEISRRKNSNNETEVVEQVEEDNKKTKYRETPYTREDGTKVKIMTDFEIDPEKFLKE